MREFEGQKIIEEISGRQAELVLDPTLLLTKKEWLEFSTPVKKKPENYLLTYLFATRKEDKQKIKETAKKFNLEIINLNSPSCKFHTCNPSEFVDLLTNAKLIYTNSYHGHAMSIALEKPFVSLPSLYGTNSRIQTLLKLSGLKNREVDKIDENELFEIHISPELEKMREKSVNFLKNSLQEIEND